MKQIIITLLVGVAAMVMSACGGGGSSDPVEPVDPMTLKGAVTIIYHYPAEVCTSDGLLNELQTTTPDAENFLLRVENNDVTCSTYGKTDGVDCVLIDTALIDPTFAQYDTSCVIGADFVASSTSTTQFMEDIALTTEFILDAQ